MEQLKQADKFDHKSHSYSFDELVAEIGSAFLCSMCGVNFLLNKPEEINKTS